jgi:hypothetical protein
MSSLGHWVWSNDISHNKTTSIGSRGITKQKTSRIGGIGRKPTMSTTSYWTSTSLSKKIFWQKGEATKVLGGWFSNGAW